MFLAACAPVPPAEPEKPAEKVVEKILVQCWDNSTADSAGQCPPQPEEKAEEVDEVIVEPVPVNASTPDVSIAKQFLEEAQGKFEGYAYVLGDRMVIVYQNKARHLFLKMSQLEDRTPITDVYVDLDAKTAVAYCNVEREGRVLENSFEWDRSKCRDFIDKEIPVPFDEWTTKGPLDYLKDYAEMTPILVEDNIQTISIGGTSKTIRPSLHYMVDGKRIVLRIDMRYKVPIKIEREGQQSIDFRDTFFDTMVLYGKQEKINKDWVEYKPVSEYWLQGVSS